MVIAVFVTVPSDKADTLAKMLVKKRVCACVNIVSGVASYFWWEGKIDSAQESLLMIKTTREKFQNLKEVVEENHPYSVPEIIALDINQINDKYKKWLVGEVK